MALPAEASSRHRRRRPARSASSARAVASLASLLLLLVTAPSGSHAFQYAVLSSTSCSQLVFSITLEPWEFKAASYLRTSLGDPNDPVRAENLEIDQSFTRSQLQSPFQLQWFRPLSVGGSYTLFFGLLDHKGKIINQQGTKTPDTVTVTLPIPTCPSSSSLIHSSKTSKPTSTKSSLSIATPTTVLSTVIISSSMTSRPALSSAPSSANSSVPASASATATPALGTGPGGAFTDSSGSGKSGGIPTGAMAGAVVGAIAATCLLLWLLALCRRRVRRSVQNHNAHRASYLGPAPRPLLAPSRQSGRYYHTPSPGTSIVPPQSKAAAFFAFFTGRSRRRRSIITGIPAINGSSSTFAPPMRQMSHSYSTGYGTPNMMYGPEHPRRSIGTVTPILRRPEDGFAPVGTAEQVAARRLSRESAAAKSVSGAAGLNHSHDQSFSYSRPNSGSSQRLAGASGTGLSPLDASDPYAYNEASATGNLVDTSDLPSQDLLADQLMQQIPLPPHHAPGSSGAAQSYPRPFLLGAQRPGSRSSSRSGQSKSSVPPPVPVQGNPLMSTPPSVPRPPSQSGQNVAGTVTRPSSVASNVSQNYLQQPYVHPHKMNRARNNDWATPYTPSLARQHTGGSQPTVGQGQGLGGFGSAGAGGGRSRSSSVSSASGQAGATQLAYRLGGIGLGLTSASTPAPSGPAVGSSSGSSALPFSPPPYQSPGSNRPGGPVGGGSSFAVGAAMTSSPVTGLIPLQLAGSASSHLGGSAFAKDGSGMPTDPLPNSMSFTNSFYGSQFGSGPSLSGPDSPDAGRARAGSTASSSGNMAGMGSGGGIGGQRGRTSMSGPTPIVPAMLNGAGSGAGGGGLMGSILGAMMGRSSSPGIGNPAEGQGRARSNSQAAAAHGASSAASSGNAFGFSPLLSAISPPAPTATGPTSFLPRSGASTPVRSDSTSPGPSTKTVASASTSTTAGGAIAPRKRPSFSYSNDPVAYMQATAGFARPPSRANSVSSIAGPAAQNVPPVDQNNPLFAALSVLDD